MWSQDPMKLCKMSFMFNNTKAIKYTFPTYRESLIYTRQIWIECNCITRDIDERPRKRKEYKVNFTHSLKLKIVAKRIQIFAHAWNFYECMKNLCIWLQDFDNTLHFMFRVKVIKKNGSTYWRCRITCMHYGRLFSKNGKMETFQTNWFRV